MARTNANAPAPEAEEVPEVVTEEAEAVEAEGTEEAVTDEALIDAALVEAPTITMTDDMGSREGESPDNPYISFKSAMGGEFGRLWNDYPLQTRIAYFIRGTKHATQNEPSSSAGKALEAPLGITKKTPKARKSALLNLFRERRETLWKQLLHAQLLTRWGPMMTGEVEAESRVSRDESEKRYLDKVYKAIRAKLKNEVDPQGQPLKLPTNDKDSITFSHGMSRTRPEMVRNYGNSLNDEGERMEDVLRAQVAEEIAREAATVAAVAKPAAVGRPEALGL